jgi:hypothetical protein
VGVLGERRQAHTGDGTADEANSVKAGTKGLRD